MTHDPHRDEPPVATSPYRELQFDGDQLVAVILEGDGVAVPVRLVCAALGLDVGSEAMAWVRAKAEALLPDDPDALPPIQEALL